MFQKTHLITTSVLLAVLTFSSTPLKGIDQYSDDSRSNYCAFTSMVNQTIRAAKGQQDIVETAIRAGSFKVLAAALEAADLVDTLKSPGPFTVFAPTDEAFAKLDPALLRSLLEPGNKDTLVAVLTYHVLAREVPASDVVKLDLAKTVNGQPIKINARNSLVKINNAKVINVDIPASNGVIHVIDTVLLPMPGEEAGADIVDLVVRSGRFPTLVTLLDAAGLVDTLKGDGPFTVFAPTEAAFAKLGPRTLDNLLKPENRGVLTAILTFHVAPRQLLAADVVQLDSVNTLNGQAANIRIDGGEVYIDNARIIRTDLLADNGVIHVIDTVMIPD